MAEGQQDSYPFLWFKYCRSLWYPVVPLEIRIVVVVTVVYCTFIFKTWFHEVISDDWLYGFSTWVIFSSWERILTNSCLLSCNLDLSLSFSCNASAYIWKGQNHNRGIAYSRNSYVSHFYFFYLESASWGLYLFLTCICFISTKLHH